MSQIERRLAKLERTTEAGSVGYLFAEQGESDEAALARFYGTGPKPDLVVIVQWVGPEASK